MNNFSICFRVFSVSFFAICIIFFIGEQRIESRNTEIEIKKIEKQILDLEAYKQKLLMDYNNEYQDFARKGIDISSTKPISINDVKIIIISKEDKKTNLKEEKKGNLSDFEKFINIIKSKIS